MNDHMRFRLKYKTVKIAVSPEIWAALNDAWLVSLQAHSERGMKVDFKLLKSLSQWHPDLNGFINAAMIRLIHYYASIEKSQKKVGSMNKYSELRKILAVLGSKMNSSVD